MARGRVLTTLPGPAPEGMGSDERRTRYGERQVLDVSGGGAYPLALEGSYSIFMTETPGTAYALSGATQTAWVATTPTVLVDNAGTDKSFIPDFVNITFATAGVAGTRVEVAVVLDTNGPRYSSGGTALVDAAANGDTPLTGDLVVYAGAITAAAAVSPTYVGRGCLSAAIPAIGETYQIEFGKAISGSKADKILRLPPIVVPPDASLLIYTWSPSQSTAPTGEISMGGWYR